MASKCQPLTLRTKANNHSRSRPSMCLTWVLTLIFTSSRMPKLESNHGSTRSQETHIIWIMSCTISGVKKDFWTKRSKPWAWTLTKASAILWPSSTRWRILPSDHNKTLPMTSKYPMFQGLQMIIIVEYLPRNTTLWATLLLIEVPAARRTILHISRTTTPIPIYLPSANNLSHLPLSKEIEKLKILKSL